LYGLPPSPPRFFYRPTTSLIVTFRAAGAQSGPAATLLSTGTAEVRLPADRAETADLQIPESKKQRVSYEFRQDVYRAFTRNENVAFTYKPDTDQFTAEKSEDGIPVPPPSRQDLLDERRRFASALSTDAPRRVALIDSLSSDRPLSTFRTALSATDLSDEWYAYKSRQIRAAVEKWALDNKLSIRESWFRKAVQLDLRSMWLRINQLLNEEEIRNMSVPMRVAEAYLRHVD